MKENYFLTRRSCRFFKPQIIPANLLDEILTEALKAPTCGNMQLYSVIISQDKENLKKLSALHYNQPAASTAPLILTICADFNRFTKWCELNKAQAGYDNFHSFIMAMTDSIIIAQQIVTIAELKGLGSCYLGTVTYNSKEISDLLKLPNLVVPVASIALGFPETEGEKTERLPLKGIIHQEKYNDFSTEEIRNIYKILEQNPENERFIKENNKENIAQVFAEVRYPKQVNEQISSNFLSLLMEKGYLK